MRALLIATVVLIASSISASAVPRLGIPGECADRNALQNMAYDARLTAIEFYYEGLIRSLTDNVRKACLTSHVLMDDRFVVINKARAIIETNCLPIDVATRMAAQGVCP
jgi:hypothetical protein